MKTWTDAAKQRLDHYLAERAAKAGLTGEEAAEVMEDWRLHVHEEMEREAAPVVSVEGLEPVLGRLGKVEFVEQGVGGSAAGGGGGTVGSGGAESAAAPRPWLVSAKRTGTGLLWFFGVIFPAGIVGFEWMTSFCASVFFDPLRTWMHLVVALLVPAVNGWLLIQVKRGEVRKPRWAAAGVGLAMVVALFYAWLFVPLIPASLLATIIWGLGLLSLSPIFAALATWRIGVRGKFFADDGARWKSDWRRGALVGIVVLLGLELGPFMTRVNLMRAVSDDVERAESGVAWLRFYHSEKSLLRACYEGNRGTSMATDISGWLIRGWEIPLMMLDVRGAARPLDSVRVRDVFYRVTGQPFNSMKPPRWARGGGFLAGRNGRSMEDLEFDDNLGGEEVAMRVKGLTMERSRIDGHVDQVAGLGYQEWTTVFRNVAAVAREARFQVQLPPGGVASRVTLWVNGEPREAAFASKAKVRAAYQEVAVRQRRDPVLVTACGPERILVQCFPVPADGGEMKIRIGMTAPVVKGRLMFPKILERNFSVAKGLEHAVWVQSDVPFDVAGSEDGVSVEDGGGHSCQVSVPFGTLPDKHIAVVKDKPRDEVYCVDPFAPVQESVLTMKRGGKDLPAVDRCVVVIDGSMGVRPFRKELAAALRGLGERANLTVLLADDHATEWDSQELDEAEFSGGRDNVPALLQAIREARKVERGVVVWVHAAQPLKSPKADLVDQLYARGAKQVPMFSVPVAPGGNRILEELFKFRAVQAGPAMVDLEKDLALFLEGFLGGKREVTYAWTRGVDVPEGVPEVSDQLARWWAATQVRDAYRVQSEDAKRVAFAAKYQLVTAYSGAVVLETAEQYARAGLKPVDPTSVPNVPVVPEPSVWWLVVAAMMTGMWRRRRG